MLSFPSFSIYCQTLFRVLSTGVFCTLRALRAFVFHALSAAVVTFPRNNIQNTITTLFFGKLANVLLRNFITTHLGHFFKTLIQRTDGCTEVLCLLVQTHHTNRCSHKRYKNRHFRQHIIFRYCDEGSGEFVQTCRLPRAFADSTRDLDTYCIVL